MIEEHGIQKIGHIRIIVCLVAWLSLFALYSQRINLSIAIIGMVKAKAPKNVTDTNCPSTNKNKISIVDNLTQKYDWDEGKQNYLLLAYNIGYLIGHIPGGLLSIKYGPRNVMICCMFASTLLTLLSIPAAQNFWLFFAIRAMLGLSNGPLYPIIHETIANYAPVEERTWLLMLTHTGNIISLVVTFPTGGYLVENIPNGWKCIFYMSGAFGVISFILWVVFVYSDPEQNPWMSKVEQNYITKSIYPKGKPPAKTISNIPFGSIFKSPHLYILTCAHFGKLFILYMNLFGLVKYLYTFYDVSRSMAGNLAVIPFIADFLFQLVYSKVVGWMKNRGMSITCIRKLNTLIGAIGCSTFLIVAGFLPCTSLAAGIVVLSLSLLFLPPYQAGYFTAIIEFAPQYSGVNMAIINVGGSFSGVLQRYITATFVSNIADIRLAYRYSFILTGVVAFLFSMVYVLFGTADLQPWATTNTNKYSEPEVESSKRDVYEESETEVKVY